MPLPILIVVKNVSDLFRLPLRPQYFLFYVPTAINVIFIVHTTQENKLKSKLFL